MHEEMNKNARFNNLIQMIVKICEIAQFARATPGSSLVINKNNNTFVRQLLSGAKRNTRAPFLCPCYKMHSCVLLGSILKLGTGFVIVLFSVTLMITMEPNDSKRNIWCQRLPSVKASAEE